MEGRVEGRRGITGSGGFREASGSLLKEGRKEGRKEGDRRKEGWKEAHEGGSPY